MRRNHLYILGLSVALLSGCSSDEEEQINTPANTSVEKAAPTPEPTPIQPVDLGDGLTYKMLAQGSGDRIIEKNDPCEFDVHLTTSEGEEIWAGDFEFTIGSGEAIIGFDRGVRGMKVGEKREVYVPWGMGYGVNGKPPIKPKQDLIFEISFLKFSDENESN
jgi:FKBP-type peptidyl-prolyl cis-trans isomerase